jgi:hypothetical protein
MESGKNMKKIRTSLFLTIPLLVFSIGLFSACSSVPDVEKLKEEKNIEGLIDVLGYENDQESDAISIGRREGAWRALVEIGAPAVEPLIEALGDKNVNIRRFAAGILGDIKDPKAADALVDALDDEMLEPIALVSLCKIGDASTAKALLEYIDQDEIANGCLIEINVNYVQPVIHGEGIAAAIYQPDTPGTHPVVITDEHPFSGFRTKPSEDDPPNWNAEIPETWRALGEPESIQLVLIWEKIEYVEIESIDYSNGVTGKRMREERTVTLREAATGEIVTTDVILGDEPLALTTFITEEQDFIRIGRVTPEILINWLRPYIER